MSWGVKFWKEKKEKDKRKKKDKMEKKRILGGKKDI